MNVTVDTSYDKMIALLRDAEAAYEVIDHAPEGRTEIVSGLRGNPLQAAAKAMVVKVKRSSGPVHALVVVPGDKRVDMRAVARVFAGRSASFASPQNANELTQCQMGAIPPFSFDERLMLVVDKGLLEEPRIYFNAARLDRSLAVDREGYLRAAQPRVARVSE